MVGNLGVVGNIDILIEGGEKGVGKEMALHIEWVTNILAEEGARTDSSKKKVKPAVLDFLKTSDS